MIRLKLLVPLLCLTLTAWAQESPPATAPARGLIGEHQDAVAAGELIGLWVNDAGPRRVSLALTQDGRFQLDDIAGSYTVQNNQLRLRTQDRLVAYEFAIASDTLTLTGGDLRTPTAFSRQADIAASLGQWLQVSPTSIQRKVARIGIILAIVVVALLVLWVVRGVLYVLVMSDWGPLGMIYRRNKNRARTIHSLILNVVKYVIYFTAMGFILSELGINYTTYIASLSVVGLAIGFGSQGLVQDTVTGFFVILERQFDVGDMVEISGQVGVVTELGLRLTTLRNYLGQTVSVPNRFIAVVGNFQHGAQQATIDVAVAKPEDIAPGDEALRTLGAEMARQFPGVIVADPEVLPPVSLQTGERFVRLRLAIWPQQTWVIDLQLVPRLREQFRARGIEIPGDRVSVSYHAREQRDIMDWRRLFSAVRSKFEDRFDRKDEGSVEV